MHIWVRKGFFPLQSTDYPGSRFWVCSESDRNFSKAHQKTYWYFKTLIWVPKNFSDYGPPTIGIADLPTIVRWKWFFSKIYKMTYWYPKTLIWARKKFCNYGRPTTVIVDFPTMVSQKLFFQKFTKWLIGTLKRLFGPEKNFAAVGPRL